MSASVAGLRARSWTAQHRMAGDRIRAPETSIDKIFMAAAEQKPHDVIRLLLAGRLECGGGSAADWLRSSFRYSRGVGPRRDRGDPAQHRG